MSSIEDYDDPILILRCLGTHDMFILVYTGGCQSWLVNGQKGVFFLLLKYPSKQKIKRLPLFKRPVRFF